MKPFLLHYHTPQHLLPPASFEIEAIVLELPHGLEIHIKQIFTGRQEIPIEELEAEGFSENDGFEWKGNLPIVWLKAWQSILELPMIEIEDKDANVVLKKGEKFLFPDATSQEEWTIFVEELTQACLEKSKREPPMELVLGRLEKNNFYEVARVLWQFSERSVNLEMEQEKILSWGEPIWKYSWEQVKIWVEEAADKEDLYQLPKSKGWFWLLNGEVWLPYVQNQKGEIWERLSKKVKGLK